MYQKTNIFKNRDFVFLLKNQTIWQTFGGMSTDRVPQMTNFAVLVTCLQAIWVDLLIWAPLDDLLPGKQSISRGKLIYYQTVQMVRKFYQTHVQTSYCHPGLRNWKSR